MKIGFYDTEVINSPEIVGWKNFKSMGFAVGCIVEKEIVKENGKIVIKDTIEHKSFDALNLSGKLNKMDLVIGFNSGSFDNNLICAYAGKDQDFLIKHFDVMKDLDTRTGLNWCTSLDSIARYTVNASKPDNMNGAMAPELWQKGEKEKVTSYCMNDCDILAQVVIFGMMYGYVLIRPNKNESLFGNMALRIPVDWSELLNRK